MNKKAKICLNAMVANEAPTITRMLDSVSPYINYWVIQDNGSTDGTQDIIKNYFKKKRIPGFLYETEWQYPGFNRDHTLQTALKADHKCDWILRMDADEFTRRLGASDWAIRNASTYAKRDAERRQFTETLDKYNQQLELADTQEKKDAILTKIGELKTTSSYARGLASAKAYIEATASGLTGTMSPERLDAFVKRMYDSANDKDPNIINRELAALISYKPGSTLGGAVGADLTALRATARANGFDLDTTFKDQINTWLQRLAVGESVGTFQNVIRSQAKLGLPDKVANLLDQGLDLSNIFAPYRNVMASVLEVAPDSINLNDATLRSAIGPEKEMSIYDFQRTLRKDSRWQYTDNARAEASDSVLKVLKDFGFQG